MGHFTADETSLVMGMLKERAAVDLRRLITAEVEVPTYVHDLTDELKAEIRTALDPSGFRTTSWTLRGTATLRIEGESKTGEGEIVAERHYSMVGDEALPLHGLAEAGLFPQPPI
jgi:hypothetical protein